MIKKIKKELRKYASEKRRKSNEWFFKTGKGEYGEGDKFIGVRVPNIRKVAKKFLGINLKVIEKLLYSKIHEERLLALLILVEQNKQAVKNKEIGKQKKVVKFYLQHSKQVNNWDLVDLSAHYILGQAILDGLEGKTVLNKLSQSKNLWQRRISIISTWSFIRSGKYDITLQLAKKLLADQEDLIHKAVGWMLREVWKRDNMKVEKFLVENYSKIPRMTLRYAIEKMSDKKRKIFLSGDF